MTDCLAREVGVGACRAARSCFVGLALLLVLPGCASVRTLDAAKPGAPIIYSGTRLDWYSLQGGCCPMDRFGAEAPKYPGLDLPFAALLETLLLPFAVAAELGVGLGVSGGN
ncbi:YceK/YidQ family lipoprotein [Pseudomonas subflava]|uniref:YceK/YidQ family lipoprotein n=1 Tax=Pseudomonas subflava TaxID=2952933 RepID=UPI00207AD74B|nr:YceK/YidQ family lipoprotein [Pseudomonas subflava]